MFKECSKGVDWLRQSSVESHAMSGSGPGNIELPHAAEQAAAIPLAAAAREDGLPADIEPSRLDVDGLKILSRLHRHGHQAYFVGGCVRDLLLGRLPKDFDIATSAHPGEVRSLFRNSRLIGRRFRLAHVYFRGGKIIEVSTFRASPFAAEDGEDLPDDLLIVRDNVFGTAEQDTLRRDFTINALAYDVRLGRVIDYVGGLGDLEARVLRSIGNPEVRMREDPVRILRAVRFAARLGFEIEPHTYAAIEGAVEELPRCAPARLLEESFRLLRGGDARPSFELLASLGALRVLLPPVAAYLSRSGPEGARHFFERLGALDRKVRAGTEDDALIAAALLSPLAREAVAGEKAHPQVAVDGLFDEMVREARLPRRIADRARQLLWAEGVLLGERQRRKSNASFRRHPLFASAMSLLEIEVEASKQDASLLERWRTGDLSVHPPSAQATGKKRRRRRGGRGRRRSGNGTLVPRPPA
jgi:poly(A) polymerase